VRAVAAACIATTPLAAAPVLVVLAAQQAKPPAPPAVSWEERKLAEAPAGAKFEERSSFAPTGKKVVFAYREADKHVVFVGTDKVGGFHYFDSPTWSANGEHVALRLGNRIEPKKEKWFAYLDTKKIAEEDWIGLVTPSPDGSEAAYWINPGSKLDSEGIYTGGKWYFVAGKFRGREWSEGFGLTPNAYSRDGSKVATSCVREGLSRVLVVEKKTEKLVMNDKFGPYMSVDSLAFAPDGKLVYGAETSPDKSSRWYVFWGDDVYGKENWGSGSPVISPTGAKIAYKGVKDGKTRVFVDHAPLARDGDAVSTPVFSADGKRVAYAINRGGTLPPEQAVVQWSEWMVTGGKWHLMVDNEGASPGFDEIRHPTFSADGKLTAFAAREGQQWRIVFGDKKSDPFDEVGPPVFSPDGKKLAFGARAGSVFWWKVWVLP
jgi:WD40 repeat protein